MSPMPKPTKKTQSVVQLVSDKNVPLEQRSILLRNLLVEGDPEAMLALLVALEKPPAADGESLYHEKLKQLEELLQLMQSGPMRTATFIDFVKVGLVQPPQALVLLEDGGTAYTCLGDEKLSKQLQRGDRVILEGKGRALL